MNKTKLAIGALALVMGVMVVSAGSALAYRGDPTVRGPNYSADRHEEMLKAFESKDYSAWKNIMQGRGRVSEVINETNFAKFAEAHSLALQGKTAEAQAIRQELGLGQRNGTRGCGGNMGTGNGLNR